MIIDHEAVLDTNFDSFDLGPTSIRRYLRSLMLALWEEQEGFSGKRPFGNSSWNLDLARGLIKAKAVKGKLDSEGYVEDVNDKQLYRVVVELINYLYNKKEPNV